MPGLLRVLTTSTLAFVLAPTNLWADGAEGYRHHDMMWGGGWGGMILGPLMMIIVVAAIVVIVVVAMRWLGASNSSPTATGATAKGPIDILKERFARGEIDRAEFEDRRQVLEP